MWPIILFFILFFYLFLPRNRTQPSDLQLLFKDLRSHVDASKEAAKEQQRREQALDSIVVYEKEEAEQRKRWSVGADGEVEYISFETVK